VPNGAAVLLVLVVAATMLSLPGSSSYHST
jgi:hypothetical protein